MEALKTILFASLLMIPFSLAGQVNNPQIIIVTADPSGATPCNLPWRWNAKGSGNTFYPGSPSGSPVTCTWTQLGSGGGGGGNLSGTLTPTQLLFGSAAHTVSGIPGSTVDPTNGFITLAPTGSGGNTLTIDQDEGLGDLALVVQANLTGSGPVGGTLVDFSAQENDAAAGGVVALDLGATETNSTGNPTNVIDLDITAADSSNIGADLVSNIFATITPQAVSGVGAEFSNIILMHTADPLPDIAPLISTGVHIQDMNLGSNPATTVNAGILIDDQTAGANVYAIKTGAGAVSLGGALALPGVTTGTVQPNVLAIDSSGNVTKQAAGGGDTNLCALVTLTHATCSAGVISVSAQANFTIASIPGTGINLEAVLAGWVSTGDPAILFQFNADTTQGDYTTTRLVGIPPSTIVAQTGATLGISGGNGAVGDLGGSSSDIGTAKVTIPFYASALRKSWIGVTESVGVPLTGTYGGGWTTSAITSIVVSALGGGNITCSMVLKATN